MLRPAFNERRATKFAERDVALPTFARQAPGTFTFTRTGLASHRMT
jgi:hypothetical protein